MATRKSTVVTLRWVLIIAFSYLLIVDPVAQAVPGYVALLIIGALASNLVVARLPEAWCESQVFEIVIVIFDALWVTLGLSWAPNVSGDLFLLYFLVIFVAAVGGSLSMIVGSAVVVAVAYGAMLSMRDGSEPYLTTAALLRVPFLFVVALFYGYFVTEIRGRQSEANDARSREQAKTELLAAVSHDLRGPLGNAENLLALALEMQEGGASVDRGLLLRAQVNVRRVSLLVTNLLQAASIEAGKVYFQLAPVQVNDVVDDVLTLAQGGAQLKDISLRRELADGLPAIVADQVQLGRILGNLIDNAIKYTTNGGKVVVSSSADERAVCVAVRDTGPGLSAEQCTSVFAPYRRGKASTRAAGTGLGLYIVKRLTEAQGGSVTVTSEVGVGSTFTVSFPRPVPAEREPMGFPTRAVEVLAPPPSGAGADADPTSVRAA
ncbi:HAMP domain-containing histidine kinase [Candidatus Binatia bacterium]|nr:HAMP domain-containing histidine kinase [Candidatus Binatia bacterium]